MKFRPNPKRKRVYVVTGAVVCAAVIVAVSISASSGRSPVPEEKAAPHEPVYLNDVLADSLSDVPELRPMDRSIEAFMKKWEIRGTSLAIMRNDSLVYAKGYGWADQEAGLPMVPGKIMRMASVSKLITATGIMLLQEHGLLSLDDKVFGPDGILCDSIYTASVRDKRVFGITVEQLLRHKGGFSTANGDPLFSCQTIMRRYHLKEPPDGRKLVCCALNNWLGYAPGTGQSYSNLGYLLLSLIIEKVTGMDYEDFIQENVLWPAGCYDMHIADSYYEDRYPNEVKYYMQRGAEKVEDYHLNGRMVERCYGGNDIRTLSGAGGWCGSPAELCRFVASIDGRPGVPDIISAESVAAMTEYIDENTFSLGWIDTKPTGEWTRTGTLSGSSALIKYYPDGECWILVTNTGTYRGPHFTSYISTLFKNCREKYSEFLPAVNLFNPELD